MRAYGVVYLVIHEITDKVYVGQTKTTLTKRKWTHLHRPGLNDYFHRSLRKYGEDSFTWHVLAEVQSKQEADNLERLWIAVLNSRDKASGYNLTAGGDGSVGVKHSVDTRMKMSQSQKAAWASGTHKVGSGWTRHHSAATLQKMSQSHLGKPKNPKTYCSVEGCEMVTHANGMCSAHDSRNRRHGSPLLGNPLGITGPLPGTWRHTEESKLKIIAALKRVRAVVAGDNQLTVVA